MTTTGSRGKSDSNNGKEATKSNTRHRSAVQCIKLSSNQSILEILAAFKITVRKTKVVIALVQIKWLPLFATIIL